jgi:hypothetical protein
MESLKTAAAIALRADHAAAAVTWPKFVKFVAE